MITQRKYSIGGGGTFQDKNSKRMQVRKESHWKSKNNLVDANRLKKKCCIGNNRKQKISAEKIPDTLIKEEFLIEK